MKTNTNKIVKRAFEVALDTRKFEIELYWKRAKYFFEVMCALGGFSVILTFVKPENSAKGGFFYLALFVISCIGIIASVAWYLTNKGSKYWQVNWEQYVNALGKEVIGPLFKHPIPSEEFSCNSLSRYSVSKINEVLSLYAIFIWTLVALGAMSNCIIYFFCSSCSSYSKVLSVFGAYNLHQVIFIVVGIAVACITLVFVCILLFCCRSTSAIRKSEVDLEKDIQPYFRDLYSNHIQK